MSKFSRMSKVCALVICVEGFGAALSPAQTETINLGTSGYWSIYVYMQDDGSYGHCGMMTGSSVGSETLNFSVWPVGYEISLDDQNWSLNVGQQYNAIVEIGGKSFSGKADVYWQHGVIMKFGFDSGFAEAFESEAAMNMEIGTFTRSLNLAGAKEALTQLAGCLKRYMPSKNPFGDGSNADPFRN